MAETEPQTPLIDRNSELPLHRQLRQIILAKIEHREWQTGDIIPREIDLTEEYGLSRYTVRQALDDLVQAGYLIRTKKRGTVVSQPKVEQNLSRFYSFARDMAAKGLEPTSRILRLEEILPDEETAQILNLEATPQAKVYHLRRLRLANAEPLVIESSYLAFTRPVDLHEHDWRVMPLYNVLESYYGIRVEWAEEFLEPVNLDAESANLLKAPLGLPAFKVERLTYDSAGQIFERRISLIRGDRYRFHVQLPKLELVN